MVLLILKWNGSLSTILIIFLSTTEHIVIQIFILKGDNEDDAEDENNIDYRTNSDGPSAKRTKTSS